MPQPFPGRTRRTTTVAAGALVRHLGWNPSEENAMRSFVLLALTAALAGPAAAQEPQMPPPLEVGAIAPDFHLPAATRHGVLRDQISLSDYRGKTVVLAFFFRARTRG
jgi:hypothetical protein